MCCDISIDLPFSRRSNVRNGIKKDLLSILSQKNTKEELDFLKKLTSFMEKRNTPIERPPMLGFKQSELQAKRLKDCMNTEWKQEAIST